MKQESNPPQLQLRGSVDPLGKQAIQRLLDRGLCRSAVYLAHCQSTNTYALAEEVPGADLPRLIVTDQQSAGRGRMDRQWYADNGTLTFSLRIMVDLVHLPINKQPLLALAGGLAVADVVRHVIAPRQAAIKWPNDVLIDRRKVAGLLVEASSEQPRSIVIGIGLNVATDFSQASAQVANRAVSLHAYTGQGLNRYALLEPLVECLQDRIDQLASDPEELLHDFQQGCALTGQAVTLLLRERSITGVVLGIDPTGGLRLQTHSGVEIFHAGEVQWQAVGR